MNVHINKIEFFLLSSIELEWKPNDKRSTEEWAIGNGTANASNRPIESILNVGEFVKVFLIIGFLLIHAIDVTLISNNICASRFPSFVVAINLLSTDCWL